MNKKHGEGDTSLEVFMLRCQIIEHHEQHGSTCCNKRANLAPTENFDKKHHYQLMLFLRNNDG